jgi:hypothetical protein
MSGLDDVYRRLGRADDQIKELKATIDAWWELDPGHWVEVVHRPGPDGTTEHHHQFVFKVQPDVAGWGIRVGECVHNLRSVLDNLAWYCAGLDGDPPWSTEFPIFPERRPYLHEGRGGGQYKISGIKHQGVRDIIEKVQPWQDEHPRQHPLWLLHELNNADKHRVVNPAPILPGDLESWVNFTTDSPFAAAMPIDVFHELDENGLPIVIMFTPEGVRMEFSANLRLGVMVRLAGEVVDIGGLMADVSGIVRRIVDEVSQATVTS